MVFLLCLRVPSWREIRYVYSAILSWFEFIPNKRYIFLCVCVSAQLLTGTGCDTWSSFKQRISGLNFEFSFCSTSYHTEFKKPCLLYYLLKKEKKWIHAFSMMITVVACVFIVCVCFYIYACIYIYIYIKCVCIWKVFLSFAVCFQENWYFVI